MIEFICREFGAGRLVWGSAMPSCDPSVPVMRLNYSLISEEDLARIAGENLIEMFAWNENFASVADDVVFPEPTDALHRAARERADLSGEAFYDSHGHVGMNDRNHSVSWDADESIREMDRCGIRMCCVFPAVFDGDMEDANEIVFRAVADHPDRYVGFSFINVNRSEAEIRSEILRGIANGMKGIKMLSSMHRYPDGGPSIELACELAHEHGLFILNHTWGPAPVLERLVRTYPNALFITGHSTLGFGEIVKSCSNVYICSCPFHGWNATESHVRTYGADRILFGSDLQDLPVAWGLAPIFYAKISEDAKRKILGENLKKLFLERGIIAESVVSA
jgi:predicted TIM-barrel fold metal-dependent hydrolase